MSRVSDALMAQGADKIDELRAEKHMLRETIRAIELKVDGLNTRALTQKPVTQDALDTIKSLCREALKS